MTTTDRQLTEREIKALQIAAKSKLTRKGDVWTVHHKRATVITK